MSAAILSEFSKKNCITYTFKIIIIRRSRKLIGSLRTNIEAYQDGITSENSNIFKEKWRASTCKCSSILYAYGQGFFSPFWLLILY